MFAAITSLLDALATTPAIETVMLSDKHGSPIYSFLRDESSADRLQRAMEVVGQLGDENTSAHEDPVLNGTVQAQVIRGSDLMVVMSDSSLASVDVRIVAMGRAILTTSFAATDHEGLYSRLDTVGARISEIMTPP